MRACVLCLSVVLLAPAAWPQGVQAGPGPFTSVEQGQAELTDLMLQVESIAASAVPVAPGVLPRNALWAAQRRWRASLQAVTGQGQAASNAFAAAQAAINRADFNNRIAGMLDGLLPGFGAPFRRAARADEREALVRRAAGFQALGAVREWVRVRLP